MSQKSKKNVNDLSDVQVEKKITENPESLKLYIKKLETLNFGLNETVNKFITQLESKDAEISHLKAMLFEKVPTVSQSGLLLPVSDEEEIAQIQINKLRDSARIRELTLDEVKRYDLLVKNKLLAQANSATKVEGKKLPANTSKTQLMQIAITKKTEEK